LLFVQVSPRSHFERGVEAYEAGHFEEAVRLFRLAAARGHARAQFNLAVCFENGKGVEQDFEQAVEFYRFSAAQGHAEAQCNLGVCFKHGEGVEQDLEQAVAFYRLAAAKGHALAQCNLAACFELGEGVEQDLEQAVALYRLAAAKGDAGAQFNLAMCFGRGRGVEQDQNEALRLLHEASDSGLELATARLAGLAAAEKDLALAAKLRKRTRKQAKASAKPENLAYLDRLNIGDATRCHNEGCDKEEASLSAKRRGVGAVESVCVV
jgi:TPR repeat protein